MATYLIDLENLPNDFHLAIEKITEKDTIIIFYTNESQKLSINQAAKINPATIMYQKCVSGRNALDFQVVLYLGYLAGAKKIEEQFFIVSKDAGYDSVKKLCKQLNIKMQRIMPPEQRVVRANSKLEAFEKNFKKQFPNVYENDYKKLCESFKKTKNLHNLHNDLQRAYTNNLGPKIFKFVKPHLNLFQESL
jgi:hypothetical protein